MSYTPPSGDSILFSFFGKDIYAPPNGDELVFSFVETTGTTSRLKYWNSTSWDNSGILKYWNGTSWISSGVLKYWNGTSWLPATT